VEPRRIAVPRLVAPAANRGACTGDPVTRRYRRIPERCTPIHDALASADRTLEFVAGDHYLANPDAAREGVADRIAAWLRARGL